MVRLILASSSPRRKELLERIDHSFLTIASNVDETVDATISPEKMVQQLAIRKAENIAKKFPNSYIIGADTIVVLEQKILTKPQDEKEAFHMLKSLSGKTHEVYTGVSVFYQQRYKSFVEKASVTFWELSDEEIQQYMDSGEPFDKAGAYGIQGKGALLVNKIEGDYYTIVGLPIAKLNRVLKEMGYFKK